MKTKGEMKGLERACLTAALYALLAANTAAGLSLRPLLPSAATSAWCRPSGCRRDLLTEGPKVAAGALLLKEAVAPVAAEELKEELDAPDVVYPAALQGQWQCTRKITLAEGDVEAAETAWRALGGKGNFKQLSETFTTQYTPRDPAKPKAGVVSDRAFELVSRAGVEVLKWDVDKPDVLVYKGGGRGGGGGGIGGGGDAATELRCWKRSVEMADGGFGYTELVTVAVGGLDRPAARVQRKYRPSNGGIDGLEIVKTYRVFEGVVSDLPTSTCKTRMRLERM
uniref:DUF6816 domain-containing protein n=1 Tax=Florenciella parvula TaxID=236787 RepID=A0A7S2BEX4_9STRA|mmetsp:Transcript_16048/g.33509  ORF Transcript_16048/g.33509 Transcript_16048/m.33509 type:complete len:282 (+) Transcript_16048:1-846(+)